MKNKSWKDTEKQQLNSYSQTNMTNTMFKFIKKIFTVLSNLVLSAAEFLLQSALIAAKITALFLVVKYTLLYFSLYSAPVWLYSLITSIAIAASGYILMQNKGPLEFHIKDNNPQTQIPVFGIIAGILLDMHNAFTSLAKNLKTTEKEDYAQKFKKIWALTLKVFAIVAISVSIGCSLYLLHLYLLPYLQTTMVSIHPLVKLFTAYFVTLAICNFSYKAATTIQKPLSIGALFLANAIAAALYYSHTIQVSHLILLTGALPSIIAASCLVVKLIAIPFTRNKNNSNKKNQDLNILTIGATTNERYTDSPIPEEHINAAGLISPSDKNHLQHFNLLNTARRIDFNNEIDGTESGAENLDLQPQTKSEVVAPASSSSKNASEDGDMQASSTESGAEDPNSQKHIKSEVVAPSSPSSKNASEDGDMQTSSKESGAEDPNSQKQIEREVAALASSPQKNASKIGDIQASSTEYVSSLNSPIKIESINGKGKCLDSDQDKKEQEEYQTASRTYREEKSENNGFQQDNEGSKDRESESNPKPSKSSTYLEEVSEADVQEFEKLILKSQSKLFESQVSKSENSYSHSEVMAIDVKVTSFLDELKLINKQEALMHYNNNADNLIQEIKELIAKNILIEYTKYKDSKGEAQDLDILDDMPNNNLLTYLLNEMALKKEELEEKFYDRYYDHKHDATEQLQETPVKTNSKKRKNTLIFSPSNTFIIARSTGNIVPQQQNYDDQSEDLPYYEKEFQDKIKELCTQKNELMSRITSTYIQSEIDEINKELKKIEIKEILASEIKDLEKDAMVEAQEIESKLASETEGMEIRSEIYLKTYTKYFSEIDDLLEKLKHDIKSLEQKCDEKLKFSEKDNKRQSDSMIKYDHLSKKPKVSNWAEVIISTDVYEQDRIANSPNSRSQTPTSPITFISSPPPDSVTERKKKVLEKRQALGNPSNSSSALSIN